MATKRVCSIPDCGKKLVAKGLCTAHYARRRLGKSLENIGKTPGFRLKFAQEVALNHNGNDCLIWPFPHNNMGYGNVSVGGKRVYAHRYICTVINGEPPTEKHHAAHTCGNGDKGCVSPLHLEWKTASENAADKVIHGTHKRGMRSHMARLTEDEVREIWVLKGKEAQKSIAKRYKVSAGAIQRIHEQKNWGWLTQALCDSSR